MRASFSIIALVGLLAGSAVASPTVNPRQFPKFKTPISSALYAAISKYPAYSTAPYLAPFVPNCIPPFGAVQTDNISIASTDTQMAVFRNDHDKEIIVGIPGDNSTTDSFITVNAYQVPYISDGVNCPTCHVHAGFLTGWNSISKSIQQALTRQLASYPSYAVIIAGHSLGGAYCSLTFSTLMGLKYPVKGAYCSGAPRVGDQAYANYIDKLSGASDTNIGIYYRATHYNDGVPQLPPQSWGYVHPRTELFEAAYNSTLAQTYRCYGQEPPDCSDLAGIGGGINNAHETYAGVRYDCRGGYLPSPPNP